MLHWTTRLLAILAIAFAVGAAPARASITTNDYLTKVETLQNVGVFLYSAGTVTGKPACNTQNRYTATTSNTTGQAIAQQAARAMATKSKMIIIGTGSCTIWPDSEDLSSVQISPPAVVGIQFAMCTSYQANSSDACTCAAGTATLSRVTGITSNNGCVAQPNGANSCAGSGQTTPSTQYGSCCVCAY